MRTKASILDLGPIVMRLPWQDSVIQAMGCTNASGDISSMMGGFKFSVCSESAASGAGVHAANAAGSDYLSPVKWVREQPNGTRNISIIKGYLPGKEFGVARSVVAGSGVATSTRFVGNVVSVLNAQPRRGQGIICC